MHFEPRFKTLVELLRASRRDATGAASSSERRRTGAGRGRRTASSGRLVDRFRGGLASLGVQRGDNVAIIANNRVEWAVAAYACYGLGAAFVPMYEAQHRQGVGVHRARLRGEGRSSSRATRSSRRRRAFTSSIPSLQAHRRPRRAHERRDATARTTSRRTTRSSTPGSAVPSIEPEPSDIAGLIYTSGTTGNPKGVILTHANIASNVSAVHEIFPMELARPVALVPAVGARLRPDVRAPRRSSRRARHGALRGRRPDPREPRRGAARRCSSACRASSTRSTRRCRSRSRRSPSRIQRLVQEALKVTAKERAGERLKVRELALLKLVDRLVFAKVRARFGGRLKYAFSRRRGALARGGRVHRLARHHGLRGLRPHRDEPRRDRELARRAQDRQRRAAPSPACASRSTRRPARTGRRRTARARASRARSSSTATT